MRRNLLVAQKTAADNRFGDGLSVSFAAKIRGMPTALARTTYTRASAKTVHHDGVPITLDSGEFSTTWDDVALSYAFEAEPAATNLALNSDGAAATWTTSNVADAGTPITGLAASLAFGNNSVQRSATKPVSVTSGTSYSVAVYVEMDDASAPVLGTTNSTGDFAIAINGVICTTNPLVKKVGSTGTLYRVSCSKSATATASHECGIIKYTGQSSKTFRVAKIQVETGVRATSHIITTGSTATRAADVLVQPVSAIKKYNGNQYVLYVSCRRDVILGANTYALSFSNGATSNRVGMAVNASNVENWVVDSGGASQVSFTGATPGTAVRKRAMSLSLDNFLSAQNGANGTSDNTMAMPVSVTVLGIGNQNSLSVFNGYIHEVKFINSSYSQAALTALTA